MQHAGHANRTATAASQKPNDTPPRTRTAKPPAGPVDSQVDRRPAALASLVPAQVELSNVNVVV
jgi:hypothetical protein